jgi:hypothetical protein
VASLPSAFANSSVTSINWKETGGSAVASGAFFAAGKAYSAAVTFQAATSYTYTGVAANAFTYGSYVHTYASLTAMGSTASALFNDAGDGNTITVTVNFPATAASSVTPTGSSFTYDVNNDGVADETVNLASDSAWSGAANANAKLSALASTSVTPNTTTGAVSGAKFFGGSSTAYNAAQVMSVIWGTDVSGATTIPASFLAGCSKMASVDLSPFANATAIGNNFLAGNAALTAVDLTKFTKVATIGNYFLAGCVKPTALDFSKLSALGASSSIGTNFLTGCAALTALDMQKITYAMFGTTSAGSFCLKSGGSCVVTVDNSLTVSSADNDVSHWTSTIFTNLTGASFVDKYGDEVTKGSFYMDGTILTVTGWSTTTLNTAGQTLALTVTAGNFTSGSIKWSVDGGAWFAADSLTVYYGTGTDDKANGKLYTGNLGGGNHSIDFKAEVLGTSITASTSSSLVFTVN